jgi:ABC-type uncharacterized transport system auxiliary subunit
MRRRSLLGVAAALAGCSVLPAQPYVAKRDWPLAVRPAKARPPRPGAPVLLVRNVAAAATLATRGLQWMLPDGSLHQDYYEQWAVPPAQAVEDALRLWLQESGLFAAVVAPGSRLPADLVLEADLIEFRGDPRDSLARAALALVLLDARPQPVRVLLQKTVTATAPLAAAQPQLVAEALQAALAPLLRQVTQDLALAVAAAVSTRAVAPPPRSGQGRR